MTITLSPEMESLVIRQVESGRYGSAREVVQDALEWLDSRDQSREAKIQDLRAKILEAEEAFENGRYITISSKTESDALLERIIRRGRKRLAAEKRK